MQGRYEVDCNGHNGGEVKAGRLEDEPLSGDLLRFAYKLVNGVLSSKERMDVVIQHYAPEWPLNQMAVVDRNILRIALFEFAVLDETPIKVAINEAIELAKDYGSESAARF